jgi:hypothetical protein
MLADALQVDLDHDPAIRARYVLAAAVIRDPRAGRICDLSLSSVPFQYSGGRGLAGR